MQQVYHQWIQFRPCPENSEMILQLEQRTPLLNYWNGWSLGIPTRGPNESTYTSLHNHINHIVVHIVNSCINKQPITCTSLGASCSAHRAPPSAFPKPIEPISTCSEQNKNSTSTRVSFAESAPKSQCKTVPMNSCAMSDGYSNFVDSDLIDINV